jgi:hypothetical protein
MKLMGHYLTSLRCACALPHLRLRQFLSGKWRPTREWWAKQSLSLPFPIADDEPLVRGICSPYHVNSKGKLKPEAFEPSPDTDEVSMMRGRYLEHDECKARALGLTDLSAGKTYRGLAVIGAGTVRDSGVTVQDSRKWFLGHADILHGMVPDREEPLPAPLLLQYRDRIKKLAKLAKYYPDARPFACRWSSGDLAP